MSSLLSDLKVVELGELISAPYCAKLLADLGADVIKIEPPSQGDASRRLGPFPDDTPNSERSGLFLYLNTNKRGITLDLAAPSGREVFLKLIKWADILVENVGAARLAALELDPAALAVVNPRLVISSISPFGQTGPKRHDQATDLVSFHAGGYAHTVGGPVEDPNATAPLKAAERQADFVAAVTSALATLGGLAARDRTGEGQRVDVSAQEALLPFIFGDVARAFFDGKLANRRKADNPPNGVVAVLPTKDGHIGISPREDHLWARWLEVMGSPDWAGDERFKNAASRRKNWAALEPLLAAWTIEHTKDEIFQAAQAARVPAFPVSTLDNVFASPQLADRGFFQEVSHPEAGSFLYPTAPYHFSGGGWELRRPAPRLGEHNVEVLVDLLGYCQMDVMKLHQSGII